MNNPTTKTKRVEWRKKQEPSISNGELTNTSNVPANDTVASLKDSRISSTITQQLHKANHKIYSKNVSLIDTTNRKPLSINALNFPWYDASGIQWTFVQWLLHRCYVIRDAETLNSGIAIVYIRQLYQLQETLRKQPPLVPSAISIEPLITQLYDILLELGTQTIASSLLKNLMGDLVDQMTDFLLCHVTYHHRHVLVKWRTGIESLIIHYQNLQERSKVNPKLKKGHEMKKEQKRIRARIMMYKAHVHRISGMLQFIETCFHTKNVPRKAYLERSEQAREEMENDFLLLYQNTRIDKAEEMHRLAIARDVQARIRRLNGWQHCRVILFGSSLSCFGSKQSDIDLCVIKKSPYNQAVTPPSELTSMRRLRTVTKDIGRVWVDENADALHELLIQSRTTLRNVQIAKKEAANYEGMNKSAKNPLVSESNKKRDKEGKHKADKNSAAGLELIEMHIHAFYSLVKQAYQAIARPKKPMKETNGLIAPTKSSSSDAIEASIEQKRYLKKDFFRVRNVLASHQCRIIQAIIAARILVLRFHHEPSGMDCDLCFENTFGELNTLLLRSYALADERLRMLGVILKSWAKQLEISDASKGYLSSYSYILLAIYYFQVEHGLMPIEIENYVRKRRYQLQEQDDAAKTIKNHQLPLNMVDIVMGFFDFYANRFDFAHEVISIRSHQAKVMKSERWKPEKLKMWRISIEDPIEFERDLGCVLSYKQQQKILNAFQKTFALLRQGSTWIEICRL